MKNRPVAEDEDKVKRTLIIGTRGSELSIKQAEEVLGLLKKAHPQQAFEIRIISTQGDRNKRTPISRFGSKGIFVAELEWCLQEEEIDIATHSLKDMPSEEPQGFTLAAVTPRLDPRDVLLAKNGDRLSELPAGARVGTGSPRRAAQIKAVRPDLEMQDIRGNIDTRMRKMREGQYDGIVLAAAGLLRMGWKEQISEYLDIDMCLPAVGQGTLAAETRSNDAETIELVRVIDDPATRNAVEAERSLLRHIGGGCLAPLTAYARYESGQLVLRGMVANPHNGEIIRELVKGNGESPEELGRSLSRRLFSLGAARLMEAARV